MSILEQNSPVYLRLIDACGPEVASDRASYELLAYSAALANQLLPLFGDIKSMPSEQVAAVAALFYLSQLQRKLAVALLADSGPVLDPPKKCGVCFCAISGQRALCDECRKSLTAILERWFASHKDRIAQLCEALR